MAGALNLRVQQLDVRCDTKTKVSFGFFINGSGEIVEFLCIYSSARFRFSVMSLHTITLVFGL